MDTASNEPAYQGIEKHMFYRICRILTLNIQLVFVFDGPGVPAKRGRHGGLKPKWEELHLLKQMLTCFGIPYQEAPAEAEAECARLQILGIVDAVWSQDSDCLMFGCTLWIHDDRVAKVAGNNDRSKDNTKKNAKTVRVIRAADMRERLGLTPEALVLFAMLSGGDYDPTGLRGCGVATALRAARNEQLVGSLVSCQNQRDCSTWSGYLAAWLRTAPRGGMINVPRDYPNYKILQKYYKPKVSSDEALLSSARLKRDNVRPIDELKLLDVTSSRFNIWGKGYMNWVGPILLVRNMAARDDSLPRNNIHDVRMVKQRPKKTGEQEQVRLFERKINFSPFQATSLRQTHFEGERLGYWAGSRDVPFDPMHRVECELPDFWLSKTLPPEVYNPPVPQPKSKTPKRKQAAASEEQGPETSSKKFKPQRPARDTDVGVSPLHRIESTQSLQVTGSSMTPSHQRAQNPCTNSASRVPASSRSGSKRRGRPPAGQPSGVIELSDDDGLVLPLPSRGKQYGLAQLRKTMSLSADLDEPIASGHDAEALENSTYVEFQPSTTTHPVAEDGFSDEEELQAAVQASLREYDGAHTRSSHKAGERSGLLNTEHHVHHSSPMSSLPYSGLASGSRMSIPRQTPVEASLRSSPAPPVYSLHTPSRPRLGSFTPPHEPVSTQRFSSTPVNPRATGSSELGLIREARLRHFAQDSSPLTAADPRFLASTNGTVLSSSIPDGAVCIDLTDD
jgi:Holliday junction resolvase YEN1